MSISFRKSLHNILTDNFRHAKPSLKICEYSLKYQEAEEKIIALFMDTFQKEVLRVVEECGLNRIDSVVQKEN